jgi:hypothetical protein
MENKNEKPKLNFSMFTPHPCNESCKDFGTEICCGQMVCKKFTDWFNNEYICMMKYNVMYDSDRIAIDGKTKSELEKEIENTNNNA